MLLADLPAKAACMLHKQYNGFFGCTHCFVRGERYFGATIFPPDVDVVICLFYYYKLNFCILFKLE